MTDNISWGLYMLVWSIVILLVWYFLSYKKIKDKGKCTEKTVGKIIGYSKVLYNDIGLPVVEYSVGNISYKVVGPKFKATIVKTISTPFNKTESQIESNLTTRDDLPDTLKLKVECNSNINITKSPLLDLYPIGSEVDVYYNPIKPKMAYVQRAVKPLWFVNAFLFIGIISLALSLYFFFGPTITLT